MAEADHDSPREYKRRSPLSRLIGGRRGATILVSALLAGAGLRGALSALPEPQASDLLTAPVVVQQPRSEPERDIVLTVRYGDTLSALFSAHLLPIDDLASVLAIGGATQRLRDLRPGDEIAVRARSDGRLIGIRVNIDEAQRLEIERVADGFAARTVERPVERRTVVAHGSIQSSLFEGAAQAGLSGAMTMSMAEIFGYDIDFLQDLRAGDRFAVIYEQIWRDGSKLRDGAILAASFETGGRRLEAVRYVFADGRAEYYARDGASMHKALTRNPVDFTRVSSGFGLSRMHPILNRIRAHEGVDYAAPAGTPVRAAGDGKVVFRGVRGGYGNVIVVQHGAAFSTLYGHLSRFARGVGPGVHVAQDEVIGFVGSTGLATAPHLHYEILVNGVHRNPRTVRLPDAAPIPSAQRVDFERAAAAILGQLDAGIPAAFPRDSST